MKTIRDAQILIGMLEQGDLNQALSAELGKVMKELTEMSQENAKATFKGTLKLDLTIEVENQIVHVKAKVDSKLPDRPRRSTLFFVTDDGELSTEHPHQRDMFGVREAPAGRDVERA